MGPTSCKTKLHSELDLSDGKWPQARLGDIDARICEWVPRFTLRVQPTETVARMYPQVDRLSTL
jgi:hypothetical protein